MTGRGGWRPGAGRKPGSGKRVKHESQVQIAEKRIADRLPWLVDKLLELAGGVCEEKVINDEETVVYQTRPDRAAAEYLVNRILGKPVDRQEQGQPGAFKAGYTIRLIRTDEPSEPDAEHAAAS